MKKAEKKVKNIIALRQIIIKWTLFFSDKGMCIR